MARMTKDEAEELVHMIKDLCELEDGLTSWEVQFVEDISHRTTINLSDKQVEKIRDLHEEHC